MRVARKSWKKALAKALVLVMALAGAIVIGAPAQASTFKSIQVQGYDAGSSKLNSTIRFRITSFVKKNPQLKVLTCIGFDDTKGQGESALGKTRATTACAQALASNPDLTLSKTIGKFDQTQSGFNNRRVVLVLSTQKDPIMTTYFNHNDGSKTRASYSASVGNEIVLPTPTREGYQFVGWFAKKGRGALVGIGGEKFVPRKNSTLFARWVSGASMVGGGGGGASASSLGTIDAFNSMYYYPIPGGNLNFAVYDERSFIIDFASQPKHFLYNFDTYGYDPADGSPTTELFDCSFDSDSADVVGEYWYGYLLLEPLKSYDFSQFLDVESVTTSDSSINFCLATQTDSFLVTEDIDANPIDPFFYRTHLNIHLWTGTTSDSYQVVTEGNYERATLTFRVNTSAGTYDVVLFKYPPV
jgi:uncharacterized repeat protein (TIGR02543 family)